MWTESLRVPLVIRVPGADWAGRVHRGRVSLLDVMPTLVELAGVDPPGGLEGRSLVAQLGREHAPFAPDPVFAHLFTMSVRLDRDLMAEGSFPGDLTVFQDRWKLMLRDYDDHLGGHVTLFDLAADPAERDDVSRDHPERVEQMSELARAWYDAARSEPVGGEVDIRPETMEQLRALGYLE
jgi:arylsulfatase A-like enzyme